MKINEEKKFIKLYELWCNKLNSHFNGESMAYYFTTMKKFEFKAVEDALKMFAIAPDHMKRIPTLTEWATKAGHMQKAIKSNAPTASVHNALTCEQCNQPGKSIEGLQNQLKGRVLCFDHYTVMSGKISSSGAPETVSECVQQWSTTDNIPEIEQKYNQMRQALVQEAYAVNRSKFYGEEEK